MSQRYIAISDSSENPYNDQLSRFQIRKFIAKYKESLGLVNISHQVVF